MPATKRKPAAKIARKTAPSAPPSPPKRPRGRPVQPPAPQDAQFLLMREVAEILRVSVDSVGRLVYGKEDVPPELDSVRILTNIRIPRASLDAYIARQTKKAGSGTVSEEDQQRLAGVGK